MAKKRKHKKENSGKPQKEIGDAVNENAVEDSARFEELAQGSEVSEAVEAAEVPETVEEAEAAEEDETVEEKTEKKAKNSRAVRALRISAALLAVCVAFAALLVLADRVTRDRIAENERDSKKEAVLSIFEKGKDCELYKTLEDGTEVYLVYRDNGVIGYCAFIKAEGYSGDMLLAVGIDSAYATEGVKVISMDENPEFASVIKDESFLSRFEDKPRRDPVGDVDTVSGATVSSEAVKAGVLAAHCIELDLSAVCAEKNIPLVTPEMLESATDDTTPAEPSAPSESADVTEPPETESETTEPVSPDTDAPETDPPETEDIPFVNNPGKHQFNYNVDASSVSDRFVIEIPKDEETATFETTTEPETTPESVVTEPPVTNPPVTEPVVTEPIVTEPPVTKPPVTEPPVTEAETTEDPNEMPPRLDTQEETMPPWLNTQEEETMPPWLGG